MTRRAAILVPVLAAAGWLAACSGSGRDEAATPTDPHQAFDAQWDAYQAQKQLFAAGRFPLPTPPVEYECPDDAECDFGQGYNIGGSFYGVDGPVTVLGTPDTTKVATLPEGDVLAVAGVEPAVYLVLDGAAGRQGLRAASLPVQTTYRDRALELRQDLCSVADGVAGALALVGDCETDAVVWVLEAVPDRWDVDDPLALSDPSVSRVEPPSDARRAVADALRRGTPAAELRPDQPQQGGLPFGPYDSAEEGVTAYLAGFCPAGTVPGCRVGYRIDDRGETRMEVTVVLQRQVGDPARLETTYLGAAFEVLDDVAWWLTESGPTAIHQNGSGDSGRADADQRFDGCCQATVGQL